MNDYTGLSDVQLDQAYAAYFDSGMASTADSMGITSEIISRQAGVLGFLGGLGGMTRFPLYEERTKSITGFSQQQAAQTAVSTAAQDVAKKVTSTAMPLLIVAVLALVLLK